MKKGEEANCCFVHDYKSWKKNAIRLGWEKAAKQAHENGDDLLLMEFSDPKYKLDELLDATNDNNIHHEIDTGGSIGEEDW